MRSAVRAVPGVVVIAMALPACGADAVDSVVAPGLEGVPRAVELTPPTLPITTRAGAPSTTTAASAPESTSVATTTATTTAAATDVAPADDAAAADAANAVDDTAGADEPAPTTTVDDPFLRRGDEGPGVVSLQQRLIALEYLASGGDTGVFDAATADALIDFQAQYGLVVDGIFGPESDRALNAAAASVTDG